MANWNLPAITSGYLDFVTELNEKFIDAATLQVGSPTNLPDFTIRFNRTPAVFEELYQGVWYTKFLGISGGGTGSSTPAGARTNLGLGSMSTQNSNAVAITGGSITGVNYNANDITSGIVALARGGTGSSLTLPPFGYPMMSDGTKVTFGEGVQIPQLNASALVVGTVPAARLPAEVAYKNQDNNFVAQKIGSYSTIQGPNSILGFNDTAAGADLKYWRIVQYSTGTLYLESMTDSQGAIHSQYSFERNGRFSCGYVSADASQLRNIDASQLLLGVVPIGRLGTNAPTGGYFLRSDNTWQPVTTASVDPVPSGLIGMFMSGCPAGWTRVAALDNRFPLGSGSPGVAGGSVTHLHRVDGTVTSGGTHRHHASLGGSASGTVDGRTDEETNQAPIDVNRSGPTALLFLPHSHRVNIGVSLSVGVSGDTDDNGNHNHTFSVDTQPGGDYPPYMSVVFCQKN